jgi:endo-1,3(4)-beta-glucanase
LGRLAVIADELNQTEVAYKIRNNMKTFLNPWFSNTTVPGNQFIYEITYGGVTCKSAINCSECDFGNYFYNDHHFQNGYFLYAAAALTKKDAPWGAQYKERIYYLARDIANPSEQDPYFTRFRHKDWYVGHSFASGLFVFGDCRNQESTSEAINAYYSIYLLGLVFQDSNMMNIGRIMLATEIRSAKKYWHILKNNTIYNPVPAARGCVGVLWETKVDLVTWFGPNIETLSCIF